METMPEMKARLKRQLAMNHPIELDELLKVNEWSGRQRPEATA